MKTESRRKTAAAADAVLFLLVLAAWIWMSFFEGGGILSGGGFSNLRYFTLDSNILLGLTALVEVPFLIRLIRTGKALPLWLSLFRLAATASVTLTLLVVLFFLGPLFGYPFLFQGPNLYLHLVVPVLAVLTHMFLEEFPVIRFPFTPVSAVPMFIYGIAYVSNVLINGRGEGPNANDWYGFLMWGLPVGLCIFAVLICVTFGSGTAVWAVNRRTVPCCDRKGASLTE